MNKAGIVLYLLFASALAVAIGACDDEQGTPCTTDCAQIAGTWQAVLEENADLNRCKGWYINGRTVLLHFTQKGSDLSVEFGDLAVLTGQLYDGGSFSVSSSDPVKDPEYNMTADLTLTGTVQGDSMTATLQVMLRDRTPEGTTEETCSMSGKMTATRQ